MNIIQTFYDNMATQYDKLFLDWQAATQEQAALLDKLFAANGFDKSARILDCACGIGTQAIGLAALGYHVTGSDISDGEIAEAKKLVGLRIRHIFGRCRRMHDGTMGIGVSGNGGWHPQALG